jgi:hypothetical protein
VAEEARRNLELKAPASVAPLEAILARINLAGVQQTEAVPQDALKLPEKDRPVLAAAMRLGCEALVTGDRSHFGAVYGSRLGGVTIHSPSSLAKAVLGARY